jgi:hypothetical protein
MSTVHEQVPVRAQQSTLQPGPDTLHHEEPLQIRSTSSNTANVIHKHSQNSFAASVQDYYSLSDSSSADYAGEAIHRPAGRSQQTIVRVDTPPELYRTPMQSALNLSKHEELPQDSAEHAQYDDSETQPFRKTPMRGQGKRRSSGEEQRQIPTAIPTSPGANSIRRKPVPVSPVMEQRESMGTISATNARSSVARGFENEKSPPTPHMDDTPYIHFALDQLTRDEDVRGSRRYMSGAGDEDGQYPYLTPLQVQQQSTPLTPQRPAPVQKQQSWSSQRRLAYQALAQEEQQEREAEQQLSQVSQPRTPAREIQPVRSADPINRPSTANLFVPVASNSDQPLKFIPGTLRSFQLGAFILTVMAYLLSLGVTAIWSRINTGLTPYGSFGDGKYFLFRYLPIMLGMIVLLWLFQVQVALHRIAPFIAMASDSPNARAAGARLPLRPRGLLLPSLVHFKAGQPVVGGFMIVAWLQLFTIPLLASSFNVYFQGAPSTGRWVWIAVQGAIWTTIALYLLLVAALLALFVWLLQRKSTGLKWDARTLADLIVLFERSNALDDTSTTSDVPRLGLWRTTNRMNEIFHTFGIANESPRSYAVGEDGRIREKVPAMSSPGQLSNNRYSDPYDNDVEAQRPVSMDAILPNSQKPAGSAIPWFLKPAFVVLWPVISILLCLAFLIVSYLPSTNIVRGFLPDVSSIVGRFGFSSGNFLYSFLPATIAMIVLLLWIDIDLAHRRLQPFASLTETGDADNLNEKATTSQDGDIPDRTLLANYTASPVSSTPILALLNGHLRVALLSTVTLLALAIPILAGGCFWSQFSIPQQRVLIYVHPAGYYALTVFVVLHALAYLAIFPESSLRRADRHLGPLESFHDIRRLIARSQILDDLAFHSPRDRTDLITRLLSGRPVISSLQPTQSKVSLADSLRGFVRMRAANGAPQRDPVTGVLVDADPRYAFGRHVARDGGECWGIDRVGR